MKFEKILILFFILILFGCEQTKSNSSFKTNSNFEKRYKNLGFALIYDEKLEKVPGVAETLDWARALVALHQDHLNLEMIEATLGIVFKDKGDVEHVKESLPSFLDRVDLQMKELTPAIKNSDAT